MMNSRERVRKAINHEEADRVPIDIGGTKVTGVHVDHYVALGKFHLAQPEENLKNLRPVCVIVRDGWGCNENPKGNADAVSAVKASYEKR